MSKEEGRASPSEEPFWDACAPNVWACTLQGWPTHSCALQCQAAGRATCACRHTCTAFSTASACDDPSTCVTVACRLRGIKLGNFEFCPTPLQLGQLRGNAFRILMRDVNIHDEQHVSRLRAESHFELLSTKFEST